MDLSSWEHDKIYMTVVNEEDKLWVEEHYKEVVEAMPARIFAGQVIKEAMDKYKSGTHSITIMETADVPLRNKHWKQFVEVGFSESAADVDFDIAKGQNPVLTVTIFVFAPGLMSEDEVAEARLEPGRVRYNNFLAIGAKTIEEDGKWGKPAYYCLQDDSWEITRDVHDHEQDIIIKEGYFKCVLMDFEAPALTIPAKKLWENLLKCKEVTGLFKGDMDLIKKNGTTGDPQAEDSKTLASTSWQWRLTEADLDAPVGKKLKRGH
ncbi:uncharacterized protein EV420DRAFT_1651418 [Desarmillaria tabescens]|uniref:Uncharacterized protein n=1 Tax=Armillaria tabescens TaxID=1929756 RepID=A0AA39JA39_ARMTA|nr:uncharacterized protein EV420DRAFT_1651418 [Desarmillaria tabescens]KAK0438494.1 hypothetical protein EV420DRAFT_1651418 [Desarmillaria tabescens]